MRVWLWGLLYLLGGLVSGAALAAEGGAALQGGVNPGYHEQPSWFKNSFLDLRDDLTEARSQGRRVLLYFYQDGCPYCKKLLEDNFGRPEIEAKTRRHFDLIALNIWGDRELTTAQGQVMSEKHYAEQQRVMYTPTMLFLDEAGATVLRLNGYYAPAKFDLALDYAASAKAGGPPFRDYLAQHAKADAGTQLLSEPSFMQPPFALARNRVRAQRPLLVLFEQSNCPACEELHRDVLRRRQTQVLLQRFDALQLDMWSDQPLVAPDGSKTTAAEWAGKLNIQYVPSIVLFDEQGHEVFRTEAYLKSFHVQSVLDYVASGAYRSQPNLQRFIQQRADHLREQGVVVDLME